MVNNKKRPINSSDWIAFLQGEISYTISFLLPLYTALIIIFIALIQMNQSVGSELLPTNLEDITFALFFILISFAFVVAWEIRPLRKLCKRIVKGDITIYEEILREYIKIEEKQKLYRKRKSKKNRKKKKSKGFIKKEKTAK